LPLQVVQEHTWTANWISGLKTIPEGRSDSGYGASSYALSVSGLGNDNASYLGRAPSQVDTEET